MVKIITDYYTKSRCYTNNRNYKKQGIIIHSTATKGVMAKGWKQRWNNGTLAKGVHAFVDDEYDIECLPETREAWHVATTKGNRYFYGIELCEDLNHTKEFFLKAYANDVEFTASIVRRLGLSVKDIYSHKEANKLGFASNHGDPEHWWTKFGYNMDRFRSDVQKSLGGKESVSGGVSDTTMQVGIKEDGYLGYNTIVALQGYLGTTQDGVISNPSLMVKKLQEALGIEVHGVLDVDTIKALQRHLGTKVDGVISKPSNMVKALQQRLNNGNLNLKKKVEVSKPDIGYELLEVNGEWNSDTIKRFQEYLGMKIKDGHVSNPSMMVSEIQRRLNKNQL